MIFPPSHHIIQSLTLFQISFRLLEEKEAEVIRSQVMKRYTIPTDRPIWESLSDHASIQNVNGWRLIDDYLSGASFVIFFDAKRDRLMVEVSSGASLTRILEECIEFEFYITDPETTYLICFNHHDFLIGAGAAKQWIEQLP